MNHRGNQDIPFPFHTTKYDLSLRLINHLYNGIFPDMKKKRERKSQKRKKKKTLVWKRLENVVGALILRVETVDVEDDGN